MGEQGQGLPPLFAPHFKLWMRTCVFDFVSDWPEETPFFLVPSVTGCGFGDPLRTSVGVDQRKQRCCFSNWRRLDEKESKRNQQKSKPYGRISRDPTKREWRGSWVRQTLRFLAQRECRLVEASRPRAGLASQQPLSRGGPSRPGLPSCRGTNTGAPCAVGGLQPLCQCSRSGMPGSWGLCAAPAVATTLPASGLLNHLGPLFDLCKVRWPPGLLRAPPSL